MNTTPDVRRALGRSGIDANRIAPGLYQGALPPPGDSVQRAGFDVLVLCAKELQYPAIVFPGVRLVYCPLDDSGPPITAQEWSWAIDTAAQVAELRQHGARVLVTCRAGRNRSGLVVALVLHLGTGVSAGVCGEHVQAARRAPSGPALSNPSFVDALARLP